MNNIKIIDTNTVTIDGRTFRAEPVAPAQSNVVDGVYVDMPKDGEKYYFPNYQGAWTTWQGDKLDKGYFVTDILYTTKEQAERASERNALLVKLQRECIKHGGKIERTEGYNYTIVWGTGIKGFMCNSYELTYAFFVTGFNFKLYEDGVSFYRANSDDLKKLLNIKE